MQTLTARQTCLINSFIRQTVRHCSGSQNLPKLPSQKLPRKRSLSELADLEEGTPDWVDTSPSPVADIEARIEASKRKLIWRIPHSQNKSSWSSKLRIFAPARTNIDLQTRLAKPFPWNLKDFLAERRKKGVMMQAYFQQFIVERHQTLGNDLASAHFLVHRGAMVKYVFLIKKDFCLHFNNQLYI